MKLNMKFHQKNKKT